MPASPTRVAVFPLIDENPYQRLFYQALVAHGYQAGDGELEVGWLLRARPRVRVLHFHWPHNYFRDPHRPNGLRSWLKLGLFTARLAAARLIGCRIAWTIHEVVPHVTTARELDRLRGAERIGSQVLARLSHVLLANDKETVELARRELGLVADRIAVVPHPSYVGVYPPGRPRAEVRRELGIPDSAFVFLLFGHVTAYKRVDVFVDAFRRAQLDDAALVVAGLVQDEPSAAKVRRAAEQDTRIKPLLEFIADDRVAELFGAADAAIAPRQDGGTSGALLLALSLGVPVLAARAATYEQITGGETAAWLFTPHDAGSMAQAMQTAAADPAAARAKGEAGRALVAAVGWEEMAATAAALLDDAERRAGARRAVPLAGERA
jgi:glycosyltransferase involved in cell wall biosynthesis